MDITALAQKELPLLDYAIEFSQLTVQAEFDDETLKSLFWNGAYYHCLVNLPDTTRLNWRKAIIRTPLDPEPSPPHHHPAA
ncbi:hypothetical protein M9458_039828, partial [Cirrhinus mrigala]